MKRFMSALMEGTSQLFIWARDGAEDPCLQPLPFEPIAEALHNDWLMVKRDTGLALLETAPARAHPNTLLVPA